VEKSEGGAAAKSPEGTLRRDPADPTRLQRLRAGVWVSAKAWLVPDATPGDRTFHVTEADEQPPPGAELVEDAIALLASFQPQSKAGEAIKAARLGEAAQFLLDVICLIEPDDRWQWFVEPVLPVMRRMTGTPPDATPFGDALGELTGARLVESVVVDSDVGPVGHYHVDAPLEAAVRTAIARDRQQRMLWVAVETWKERFLDEMESPTRTTVRAGVGTAVYLARCKQVRLAFDWVEQKVLPVARRTGETAPVLFVLEGLARESGDAALVARAEALR
jgi:hypothetical protein